MDGQFDVVIVGAATAGSFLAQRIAREGFSVLVIEAKSQEQVGAKYDIFHIAKGEFERFGLPKPEPGDDFAFTFTGGTAYSAFGRFGKATDGTTVGMHMHAYTLRMNRFAQSSGAVIEYEAAFEHFLYDGKGRIEGVAYRKDGKTLRVRCRLAADCSGVSAAARTALEPGYGVENFALTPEEMFYVTLRYVQYENEADFVRHIRTWTYYKTWEAPEADPHGAILGVGANLGFDYGERSFAEFERAVPLPKYTLKYIEKGTTPYRRPPYSFVADGFLVSGDAACLTKPSAGEGVTSAMVQIEIAAEVISGLLRQSGYLSRAALWPINKRYIEAQGKSFASQMATLVGAVATNAAENDFFFENDVIFSEKSFASLGSGEPLAFTKAETAAMAGKMLTGVLKKRLRLSTILALLRAMRSGERIAAVYADFPETPEGFDAWTRRAERQWKRCGSMADALKKI